MNEIKRPSAPPTPDRALAVEAVERRLNEGIDDLDAGRIVTREQSRQRIAALLASYETKRAK